MKNSYQKDPFFGLSHRGNSQNFIENSLEAFNSVIQMDYKYIETDLRMTLDGEVIAFHDPDLRRLFNMLVVGILIYIFICIYSLFITSATDFFILAGLVGLVQGGVQSVSRTIFSRLIPEEKATEFFGFYNLIGKSAVVVGPALVGWMAYIFNNPKAGIISLLILFIPGILILFYVPRTSLVRD